jgi:hypothetical protein
MEECIAFSLGEQSRQKPPPPCSEAGVSRLRVLPFLNAGAAGFDNEGLANCDFAIGF